MYEGMKRFFNNYRLPIFIGIVLLLVVLILMCLALDKEYSDDVLVTNYSFGNGDIVVSNSLPMTDAVGKTISIDNCIIGTTGYIAFEVKSMVDDKVKYEFADVMVTSLDFKLSAEILKTVIIKSKEELVILAAVFIIRIIMTFVLEREMKLQRKKDIENNWYF